jgi:DNA recombination protein RmuC
MMMVIVAAVVALVVGVAFGVMQGKAALAKKEAELQGRTDALSAAIKEIAERKSDLDRKSEEIGTLKLELATLHEKRKSDQERLETFAKAAEIFKESFQALAADALKSNNQNFLELAKAKLESYQKEAQGSLKEREVAIATLVDPIKKSLEKVDTQIQEIEKSRHGAFTALTEQLKFVISGQDQLKTETNRLVTALRRPEGRGRWGEIQLKRVVEMAGMVDHCDFLEQEVTISGQRPDMVVKLPGNKQVVVDSKVPLDAYLKAIEATDETERALHLASHARQIQDHIKGLSAKKYWEQFKNAPEFVVMFLPGEFLFSAALQENPALIEEGSAAKVIIASPTTLIAILRAVAYGWQQTKLAENAQKISELGKRLYDSARVMGGHMEDLGDHLEKSVKAYNKTVGSMEKNVFSAGRKFPELGVGATEEITLLDQIEETPRQLQSPDWTREVKHDAAKA